MTWKHVPLVDLLEVSVGGVWGAPAGDDELDVRVWRVTELKSGGRLEPDTAARRSVSRRQFSNRSLLPGDLLLEKSGGGPKTPVGRVGLVRAVPEPSVCSNFMQLLRPDVALVEPRYLHLFLNHFHDAGCTEPMQTASTNIRNIKASDYVRIEVPLPPLDEQRRIVAILEDHLSHLDAAEDAARDAMRRTRTLVASSATRLVSEATRSCPMTTLGEYARLIDYGTSAKCHVEEAEKDIPVLRMGNIRDSELDWENLKYLNSEHSDLPKLLLEDGDLLFNRTNSAELVGKSAVFRGQRKASFASYLIRARFDDRLDPDWANLVINSPQGRAYVASCLSQQVGQANVNGKKLRAFPMPLPPVEHQRELVDRHHRVLSATKRLEKQANSILEGSKALRRSILNMAFSGRLTSPGQDLSELSERIGV